VVVAAFARSGVEDQRGGAHALGNTLGQVPHIGQQQVALLEEGSGERAHMVGDGRIVRVKSQAHRLAASAPAFDEFAKEELVEEEVVPMDEGFNPILTLDSLG
jgi:hypothetical protein